MSISSGPPRAIMYVYPWDLFDEGIDTGLETIAACGFDSIQLAVSYHIATYLLPRNPHTTLFYGNHGAVYFEPDPLLYGRTSIRPKVWRSDRSGNGASRIVGLAHSKGMHVAAWAVYCYNHHVARNHPEYAVQNVFGDANAAQLCPAHPDVREYVLALTRDLSENYAFDGIVVESLSYLPFDYGFLNPKLAVELPPDLMFLLGLCFCPHCQEQANSLGVDVALLQRELQVYVKDYLNQLPDGKRAPKGEITQEWLDHAFEGRLLGFLSSRSLVATSLQEQVLHKAREHKLSRGSTSVEGQIPAVTGIRTESILPLLSEERLFLHPKQTHQEVVHRYNALRSRSPEATVYALVQPEQFASESGFQETLRVAKEVGIEHYRVYNYGLLTSRQMEWIRDAQQYWT